MTASLNDQSDADLSHALRRAYADLAAWRARSNRYPEPARPAEPARVAIPPRVLEPMRSPDPARR